MHTNFGNTKGMHVHSLGAVLRDKKPLRLSEAFSAFSMTDIQLHITNQIYMRPFICSVSTLIPHSGSLVTVRRF